MRAATDEANHVTVTTDGGERVFSTRQALDCDDIAGVGFAECIGRWLVLVADFRGDEDWQLIVTDVTDGRQYLRIPACGAGAFVTGAGTVIVPAWLSGRYSVLEMTFGSAGEPCFDLLLQTSRHDYTAAMQLRGGSVVIQGGGPGAPVTILHPPACRGGPWREELLDQERHGWFAGCRAGVTYSYLPHGEVVAARAQGRTSVPAPAGLEPVLISGELGVGLRSGPGGSRSLVPFAAEEGVALPGAPARHCTFLREGRRPGEVMVHSVTRELSLRQSAWELAGDRRRVVIGAVREEPPLVRCSWTAKATDSWQLDIYSGEAPRRGVLVECYGAYGNALPPLFPRTWAWCLGYGIDVVVVNPRGGDGAGRSLRSAVALAGAVSWIMEHISAEVVCAGSSAGAAVLLSAIVWAGLGIRGAVLVNPLIPHPDGRLPGKRDQREFASAAGLDWAAIARAMWVGGVGCRGAISVGRNDARIDAGLARQFCAAQAAGAWPYHVSSPGGHRGSSPRIEAAAADFLRARILRYLGMDGAPGKKAGDP